MLLAHLVFAFGLTLPIQAPAPKPPAPPTIEEVVAAALKSHPEILAVEAKLAGVKAELELAKLSLSQRVLKAKNRLDSALLLAGNEEEQWKIVQSLVKSNGISPTEVTLIRAKLLAARYQLAEAEAEWQMYEPPLVKRSAEVTSSTWAYKVDSNNPTPKVEMAPPTEAEVTRFEALAKIFPIKKDAIEYRNLVEATKLIHSQFLLVHPDSKKLLLRVPEWTGKKAAAANNLVIESIDGEMTFGAWLGYVADEFNKNATADSTNLEVEKRGPYEWYIREYGLMFEKVSNKPVGAPSLSEFMKAMRSVPAPKK